MNNASDQILYGFVFFIHSYRILLYLGCGKMLNTKDGVADGNAAVI